MTAGRHRSPESPPTPVRRWATRRNLAAVGGAAAVTLVVGVAVLVAPAVDTRDNPPWPGTAEATDPDRAGRGGVSPSAGPLQIPSIGAPGAWDPAAATPDPGGIEDRCGRCGDRTTPAAPAEEETADTEEFEAPLGEVPAEPEAQPAADPATDRARIVADTNTARAQLDCAPVTVHPDLDAQAQMHAQAMADDQSMHHSAGVTGFNSWGENVARGYGADTVVQAWMDSPGHRANIGTCDFTHLGVGWVDAPHGPYAVQQFAN